jgi:hypothetical protein
VEGLGEGAGFVGVLLFPHVPETAGTAAAHGVGPDDLREHRPDRGAVRAAPLAR